MMPLWFSANINRLKNVAVQAESTIVELFVQNQIVLDTNSIAWGQFLNSSKDNNQYGIYGTSAGIQVLQLANELSNKELLSRATRTLDGLCTDVNVSHTPLLTEDCCLIFKLVFLADALTAGVAEITESSPILEKVLSRMLPAQGWGNYYVDSSDKDTTSSVNATALALLALRKYKPFIDSKQYTVPLTWICNTVIQNANLAQHEIALASIAIVAYNKLEGVPQKYDFFLNSCRIKLVTWAKQRKSRRFGATENYHYNVQHNTMKYLFFLPDYLVALALLRIGSPKTTRSYVLYTVNRFVSEINEKGGFAPESTRMFASVDQLWTFRLLREFRLHQVPALTPSLMYQWIAAPNVVKLMLVTVFLLLGLLGSVLSIDGNAATLKNNYDILSGDALAAISFGIVGTMMFEFYIRSNNDYS